MSSTQTGSSSVTDQAKGTAQQATQQAKETAQQATEQARGRVRVEVDRRSTDVGEQATSVADAMRQSAQQLREQGKDPAAKPVEQVAQRVEQAGSWLRDSDGDTILGDVEDFARRNPLAVVAGGVAVGFALSRVLKASSTQRYEQRSSARLGAGYGRAGTTVGPYGAPAYGDGERIGRAGTLEGAPGAGPVPPIAPEPPTAAPGPPDVGAVTPGGARRGGVPPESVLPPEGGLPPESGRPGGI